MNSVVCTLFESHYHYGVAALVNSLHRHGFKGDVYAGYLGELPAWAQTGGIAGSEQGVQLYQVNEAIKLHFIKLDTHHHLTNYKPEFMKWLWDGPAADAGRMYYFDPDIVIRYSWNFFEEWADCGVALSEDVNSPLPLNHPRRMAWKSDFKRFGIELDFRESVYANAGFLGLSKKDKDFLATWNSIQEKMGTLIGGLDKSPFVGKGALPDEQMKHYFPYNRTDQDALNIAVGLWTGPVSFVGKEGMGFKFGPELMLHAIGHPKPWQAVYLRRSLTG